MLDPGDEVEGYVIELVIEIAASFDRYTVTAPDGAQRMLEVLPVSGAGLIEAMHSSGPIGKLDHPNVLAVHDVIEVSARPGIVHDLIEAPTLRQWMASPTVTLEQTLMVFRGIVEGIAYGQKLGLVHLELRAGTVRVETSEDGMHTPKIEGMGIAKAIFEAMATHKGVSRSKGGLAEPRHAAPEAIRNPHRADGRADMYSLGCILYEMLAGTHPFAGLNYYDCYSAKREERWAPLDEVNPVAGPLLTEIVTELMRAEPERRIQTGKALLERLDAIALPQSVTASRRPQERHPLDSGQLLSGGYLLPQGAPSNAGQMWGLVAVVAIAGVGVMLAAYLLI